MKILSLQHPRIRTIPLRANTRKHNKDCTAKLSLSNEKSSDAFYGVIFPISCIFFCWAIPRNNLPSISGVFGSVL